MELLLWAGGLAVPLLLLVLVAGRRQRRSVNQPPHGPTSPGAPAGGSPSASSWTFGGGSV